MQDHDELRCLSVPSNQPKDFQDDGPLHADRQSSCLPNARALDGTVEIRALSLAPRAHQQKQHELGREGYTTEAEGRCIYLGVFENQFTPYLKVFINIDNDIT